LVDLAQQVHDYVYISYQWYAKEIGA
jgi:hypothetical protein